MDVYYQLMLTTEDNPYNPFDDYDAWYAYDSQHGYNSPSYLARTVELMDLPTPEDEELAVPLAIADILELDLTGNYTVASKLVKVNDES